MLRLLLSFLMTLGLYSCISQPVQTANNDNGSGSGFGGTGIVYATASTDEGSGFGGTGIVGTINAFGSIWVNGIEIDYPKDVKIQSNLGDVDNYLKLGQAVILETDKKLNQENHPTTQKIKIYYPFAGKIQDIKNNKLLIHNQWINFTKTTHRDEGLILEAGQYIAINANQDEVKNWFATRLNNNPKHKVINQPMFKAEFSEQVGNVIIEGRMSRMQNRWKMMYQHRLIMRGKHRVFMHNPTMQNRAHQLRDIKDNMKDSSLIQRRIELMQQRKRRFNNN